MARTFIAYINQEKIPLRKALQTSLNALGYKLVVEDDYVPLASSGYLPCTLDGEDAGLTIRFMASENVPDKDTAISLQWGGDDREKLTVLMVATALVKDFDAIVYDDQGAQLSLEALSAMISNMLSEMV